MKQIREWKRNKTRIREESIKLKGKKRKILDGAGRKPFNGLVNNPVMGWIYDQYEEHLKVSCALIMKKVNVIYDDLPDSEKSE